MRLGEPIWLQALWALPALALVWLWSARARRRLATRFADASLLALIGGRVRWLRRGLHAAGILLALGLISVALARPQWNPEERDAERRGRDIVFLIDVSRSMLAEDLAPNRLERTKIWINDLIASLSGDRIGLVAFAGAPVVRSPLTLDYSFFRMALDELGPQTAPRGGTNIGDAIRKTLSDVFENDGDDSRYRDIILITDGEDQESLPIAAAEQAGEMGVRIIALGIGSETQGATIPADSSQDDEDLLRFQGQVVRSKQDAATLERIASASAGGVYLNIGTGTINLERVYENLIRSAEQRTFESASAVQYDEGFVYLLLGALVVFVVEAIRRDL
jgi:Ca-activated chloride channel family protein